MPRQKPITSAIERLRTLRVADAMSKQVVSVASHDSMAQAARVLLEHSISGAPVVDEQEFCVGVVSAIDFVKQRGCTCRNLAGTGHMPDAEGRQRPPRINGCNNDLVCHHMTPSVQSIAAEKPLLYAARIMCEEHIHRLPVLDCRGRPAGMITALDIVAALVNAIEE